MQEHKTSCRVATTTNITLFGTQVIDGVAVDDTEPSTGIATRVLVKNQSIPSQNGIYVVRSGAWERAPDFSNSGDVTFGAIILVREPVVVLYVLSTPAPISVESTGLVFEAIGDSTGGGGGGGGDFDPSEVVVLSGIVYVDIYTSIDTADQTGSQTAPFSTIAAALIAVAPRTSEESVIYLSRGSYSESLGFNCGSQSLSLVAMGNGPVSLTGSHSITFLNNGTAFRARGIDFTGTALLTCVDGFEPPSTMPGRVELHGCNNARVVMAGGATGIVNLVSTDANIPEGGILPEQSVLRGSAVFGTLRVRGVKLGSGSGAELEFTCASLINEDCVFESGVSVNVTGAVARVRSSRFIGATTITFTGSPGVVTMDLASVTSWANTATKTLINGTINSQIWRSSGQLHVDASASALALSARDGSALFPFATITQAIAAAVASGNPTWIIDLARGTYPEAVSVPETLELCINGHGFAAISGGVTWTVADNGYSLQLDSVGDVSISIEDGSTPALLADPANLVLLNCFQATVDGSGMTGIVGLVGYGTNRLHQRERAPLLNVEVTGKIKLNGIQIGTSTGPATIQGDEITIEDGYIEDGAVINATSTLVEMRTTKFAAGVTVEFLDDPGELLLDATTNYWWKHASVSENLLNGTKVVAADTTA